MSALCRQTVWISTVVQTPNELGKNLNKSPSFSCLCAWSKNKDVDSFHRKEEERDEELQPHRHSLTHSITTLGFSGHHSACHSQKQRGRCHHPTPHIQYQKSQFQSALAATKCKLTTLHEFYDPHKPRKTEHPHTSRTRLRQVNELERFELTWIRGTAISQAGLGASSSRRRFEKKTVLGGEGLSRARRRNR
jgi:hypothetical protein